jgi:hypothetical protein
VSLSTPANKRSSRLKAPTEAICCRCAQPYLKTVAAQKYCDPCKPEAFREGRIRHGRARRRLKGQDPEWREKNTQRQKVYYRKTIDKQREYHAEYGERNSARKTAAAKAWREAMGEKLPEWRRQRYLKTRDKVRAYQQRAEVRERRRERERKRREQDPRFVIDDRISANVRKALKGKKAGRSWEVLVGYTLDDLTRHLERQFVEGMSWDNLGEWHIDHIVPLSRFSYTDVGDADFRAAWALTNLRPLWGPDNLKKHAKLIYLI